jgi:Mn-dependent DtxR family transcriptional regulator
MPIDSKYLEFLRAQSEKRPLRIPRNVSKYVVKDRELMRAAGVYIELKSLFYNSTLKKARKRRETIAAYLDISRASYSYKLKRLIFEGLARYDKEGNLHLSSWADFCSRFDEKSRHFKRIRFYNIQNRFKNSYKFFMYYAIHENFESQKHALERKIIKEYFSGENAVSFARIINTVIKNNSIATKEKQRRIAELTANYEASKDQFSKHKLRQWKKAGGLSIARRDMRLIFEQSLEIYNRFAPCNFSITVGCKKFAELIGLSAPSSGHYWQRQFNGVCMNITPMPSVFVPNVHPGRRYEEEEEFHYFNGTKRKDVFKGRGVYRRVCNSIELVPFFQV